MIGGKNVRYDFSNYKTFKELFRDLYQRKMTIDDAKHIQNKFDAILYVLSEYSPRGQKYTEAKNKFLDDAKSFYRG